MRVLSIAHAAHDPNANKDPDPAHICTAPDTGFLANRLHIQSPLETPLSLHIDIDVDATFDNSAAASSALTIHALLSEQLADQAFVGTLPSVLALARLSSPISIQSSESIQIVFAQLSSRFRGDEQALSREFLLLLWADESVDRSVIHNSLLFVASTFNPASLATLALSPIRAEAVLRIIAFLLPPLLSREDDASVWIGLWPSKTIQHTVTFAAWTLTACLIAIGLQEKPMASVVLASHPPIVWLSQ